MKSRFRPEMGWRELVALVRPHKQMVQRFEAKFAQKFGAGFAVAFPYGRSAQWAFFKALGIENKEVLMPAYTCSVVAHAVTLSGNSPKFVDISLYDYNMQLDLLEEMIGPNTGAVIATHTFGYPQDIDRLESIIREGERRFGTKIWLIQDCCHAFDASWRGRSISSAGDVSVYAFNISKLMTSIFGGMLTFKDEELAKCVRNWRDARYSKPGILKSISRRIYLLLVMISFNPAIYGIVWWIQNKTSWLHRLTSAYHLDEKVHFPPDYRDFMLDVEAAVGIIQLDRYDQIIAKRRAVAESYLSRIKESEDLKLPPMVDGATYSHFVIRVKSRERAKQIFAALDIEIGELIQYSIPDTYPYRQSASECPNSAKASKETINLPLWFDIFLDNAVSPLMDAEFYSKNDDTK